MPAGTIQRRLNPHPIAARQIPLFPSAAFVIIGQTRFMLHHVRKYRHVRFPINIDGGLVEIASVRLKLLASFNRKGRYDQRDTNSRRTNTVGRVLGHSAAGLLPNVLCGTVRPGGIHQ